MNESFIEERATVFYKELINNNKVAWKRMNDDEKIAFLAEYMCVFINNYEYEKELFEMNVEGPIA